MARRVTLPSAEDLFRTTDDDPSALNPPPAPIAATAPAVVRAVPAPPPDPDRGAGASGRVRHDEKMTVYVTAEELLAIEQARLTLRAAHGLAVDRGRLVREAIHLALEDLESGGGRSALVRRLADDQG